MNNGKNENFEMRDWERVINEIMGESDKWKNERQSDTWENERQGDEWRNERD